MRRARCVRFARRVRKLAAVAVKLALALHDRALQAVVLPFLLSRELRAALLLALQLRERLLVSVKLLLRLAVGRVERLYLLL